jgi:hypothetical protein
MLKMKRIVTMSAMILLAFIPLTSTSADAMPPPSIIWFTFEYTIPQQPAVESIKILLCENADCSSYTSLDPKKYWLIQCAENWCRWEYYPPTNYGITNAVDENPPNFRLQLQFSGSERISNMAGPLPATYGGRAAYKVTVNDTGVVLTPDNTIPQPGLPKSDTTFLITLIFEPIVMAVVLAIWLKPKFTGVIRFWGLALIVNIIAYPVLWSYFPSIAKYHTSSAETWGYTILTAGILFPFLFVLILNASRKGWRIAWLVITIVLFLVCTFLGLFANGMASYKFVMEGLSFQNAILLLEVTAVVYEGLLFYGLNKRKVPLLPALAGSLAMNLVSFLVGLLIYNPWAGH